MNILKIFASLLVAVCLLCGVYGCERERTSGVGLYLPEGDIDKGKITFVELGCNKCHTVDGVELPVYEGETSIAMNLGGEVLVVKTYGELVTSIVNPEHIISSEYRKMLGDLAQEGEIQTLMPSFNQEMNVAQLIDLVTFLDSTYQKMEVYYSDYRYRGIY